MAGRGDACGVCGVFGTHDTIVGTAPAVGAVTAKRWLLVRGSCSSSVESEQGRFVFEVRAEGIKVKGNKGITV